MKLILGFGPDIGIIEEAKLKIRNYFEQGALFPVGMKVVETFIPTVGKNPKEKGEKPWELIEKLLLRST
ncbi:MAG TPA: hypothetical protein DEA52_01410 [Clostridiaceae bacterium]|nr:hypothetical protein [Clostridiaceae bacterium]